MFFTQINQLMAQSVDITMVIRKSATGMTVSVLPKSNGLKDEAQNHIVPLTLSGLPEELDAGFMNAIANPVRKVSGLLTNMAEFEKQADKAAAKREKYEKHMKKAEELIAARNHRRPSPHWDRPDCMPPSRTVRRWTRKSRSRKGR